MPADGSCGRPLPPQQRTEPSPQRFWTLPTMPKGHPILSLTPTVPQGIGLCHGTSGAHNFTVGVIAVGCCFLPSAIYKLRHVPLEVGDVVIGCWAGRAIGVGQRIGGSLGVVGKVQNLCCDSSVCSSCGNRLPQQFSTGVV